jgi:hypothetical protein
MVKKEEFNGKEAYKCETSGFQYEDKEMAEKCENDCEENGACSMEIAMEALEHQ